MTRAKVASMENAATNITRPRLFRALLGLYFEMYATVSSVNMSVIGRVSGISPCCDLYRSSSMMFEKLFNSL